ncbi:MAG TPA: hypothetical protein VF245_00645 [Solirubrobacterales bacterium]
MAFKAPKQSAFRQFVILDSDGTVAALSAIDGGQIDEILTRSAEERDGGLGGEVGAGPVKAKGKRSKSRKVEEEIRRARTRHATAAKLLDALRERESIGVVDGALDMEVFQQLQAGMVLEFRAELQLHPLHKADQMLRSFIEVGPKLDQKQVTKELRQVLDMWGVISGTGQDDAPVLIEPSTQEEQVPRLLLPVPQDDFEVNIDDLLGEVTVVAQVEQILNEGEAHQVIRVLKGGPATSLERGAIEETLPGLSEGLGGIGIDISEDDVFIRGPALILRAICAYR